MHEIHPVFAVLRWYGLTFTTARNDTPFDPEKGAAGRGENPAVGDNPTA
jgi:hypothetical protein